MMKKVFITILVLFFLFGCIQPETQKTTRTKEVVTDQNVTEEIILAEVAEQKMVEDGINGDVIDGDYVQFLPELEFFDQDSEDVQREVLLIYENLNEVYPEMPVFSVLWAEPLFNYLPMYELVAFEEDIDAYLQDKDANKFFGTLLLESIAASPSEEGLKFINDLNKFGIQVNFVYDLDQNGVFVTMTNPQDPYFEALALEEIFKLMYEKFPEREHYMILSQGEEDFTYYLSLEDMKEFVSEDANTSVWDKVVVERVF